MGQLTKQSAQGLLYAVQEQSRFSILFSDLYKQGVEEMLKAELDEHLGYEKHSKEGPIAGIDATAPIHKR